MCQVNITFNASDEQIKELEEGLHNLCNDLGIDIKRLVIDYGDNCVVDCNYKRDEKL